MKKRITLKFLLWLFRLWVLYRCILNNRNTLDGLKEAFSINKELRQLSKAYFKTLKPKK